MLNHYGEAIVALKLPQEKANKLERLLAESTSSVIDALDLARRSGVLYGSPEMKTVEEQAEASVDGEIRALLSPEDYESIAEASRYESALRGVDQVEEALFSATCPMTQQQTTQLAQVEADYMRDTLDAGTDRAAKLEALLTAPPDPDTGLKPVQQQELDRAAGFLSQAQLAALKQYWLDSNEMAKLQTEAVARVEV